MRLPRIAPALLPLLAACGEPLALEPNALERSWIPGTSGVEHVLAVQADTTNGIGSFTVHSTLRNTGGEPALLRARSCYLQPSDVRGGGGGLRLYQPLILCLRLDTALTLAPGEESETLTVSGQAPPGSVHDLQIRHALHPEHWTPLQVRIP